MTELLRDGIRYLDGLPLLRWVPLVPPMTGHGDSVRWGAWGTASDRPVLVTGGHDGTVRLWDPAAGTALGPPLADHGEPVLWGAWGTALERPVLATTGRDGIIWLSEPETGSLHGQRLAGHVGPALWGSWGMIGNRRILATGGSDGTVRLWDPVASTDRTQPLAGHAGPVMWGSWGTIGNRPVLATGGSDGTVRLWDPAAGTARGGLPGHTGHVLWGSWGTVVNRPVLATGGQDGTVRLWDPAMGTPLRPPMSGHAGPVRWGAWGRIGGQEVVATGGADRTVRLWDPASGTAWGQPLASHALPVLWGAWGMLGNRPVPATGTEDGAVRLWDPAAGTALGPPLISQAGPVSWGAWGTVGGRPVLATGGPDRTVGLWEVVEDRSVPRLPPYRSDAAAPTDELARLADAVALAELVTAKSATPPLAVGLFGDWGEGKSHFLELLHEQVAAVARPDNVLAHSAIRQVKFNAWHYAETDLWASLVTELFAQLAVPPDGDAGAEQRRQSRLTADLVTQRGLRERLQAARDRRDDLQKALRKAKRGDLGSWEALSGAQKEQLTNLIGPSAEKYYRDAIRTASSLQQTGRLSWQLLRTLRVAAVARLGVIVAVIAAAAVAADLLIPSLVHWMAATWAVAASAVVTVVGLWRHGRAEMAKQASAAWKAAVRIGQAQRQRLQTASDVAAAEVAAMERELQNLTAAGQLAGLTADRVASQDYRSRLGVMTQIREDFSQMAALLAEATRTGEPRTDAVGDALPRIDRIVLYIDDLDRCPPRRVVEMLEAIHLLLAVPLFVVVVAVEPRWLLRAITAHYRDLLQVSGGTVGSNERADPVDPDDEELWNSTPAQYLEKIFQVVLTLPPLDDGGYQRLLRTLVSTRKDQVPPVLSASPRPVPGRAAGAPVADAGAPGDARAPWAPAGLFGAKLPAARVVERVDPLTLEPDEMSLLDLLGPPLLVTTPRATKRLANSYGLLTALRRDNRSDDLSEYAIEVPDPVTKKVRTVTYFPYRAGMVLLSALIAFPALGPALFLHLHHTGAERPGEGWEDYLNSLVPSKDLGRWRNPADPDMTPVQAQQWQALIDALLQITRTARERKLPLPEPLAAWHEWVVPVGRMSFPTGRIVNTLERQRPLP